MKRITGTQTQLLMELSEGYHVERDSRSNEIKSLEPLNGDEEENGGGWVGWEEGRTVSAATVNALIEAGLLLTVRKSQKTEDWGVDASGRRVVSRTSRIITTYELTELGKAEAEREAGEMLLTMKERDEEENDRIEAEQVLRDTIEELEEKVAKLEAENEVLKKGTPDSSKG